MPANARTTPVFGDVDADAIVPRVGEVNVTGGADRERVHAVEGGLSLERGDVITVVALHAQGPRERLQLTAVRDHSQSLALCHLDDEDPAIGVEVHAKRLDELRLSGVVSIAKLSAARDE